MRRGAALRRPVARGRLSVVRTTPVVRTATHCPTTDESVAVMGDGPNREGPSARERPACRDTDPGAPCLPAVGRGSLRSVAENRGTAPSPAPRSGHGLARPDGSWFLVASSQARFVPPSPFHTTMTVFTSPGPVVFFNHSRPWGLVFPNPPPSPKSSENDKGGTGWLPCTRLPVTFSHRLKKILSRRDPIPLHPRKTSSASSGIPHPPLDSQGSPSRRSD